MSSRAEVYTDELEDDDTQPERIQVMHLEQKAQSVLAIVADRLLADEPSEVLDYIGATLAEPTPAPTYMDDETAKRIGRWLGRVIAQAADDREGMLTACVEARR